MWKVLDALNTRATVVTKGMFHTLLKAVENMAGMDNTPLIWKLVYQITRIQFKQGERGK